MTPDPTVQTQAERVHALMDACLYQEEELENGPDDSPVAPADATIVEGIVRTFTFDPARVKENEAAIRALIKEVVPDTFFEGKGGGWSFLNLCMNRDDEQWAEHPTMEALVVLGLAVGAASYCLPREMWSALPGGVPYVKFEVVD